MAKQQAAQKYIFKISTGRLKKAKWDLSLSLTEARRNEEMISLNDSQMLRWIDELNGLENTEEEVRGIKKEIARLKRQPHSQSTRAAIKRLYGRMDELQFKPDYLHLVIERDKDLFRACQGFKVNGVRFVRLLGTNGGVKLSTIVFVSERLAPLLRERIENGRDASIPQIPAKLEAYRALTCSASIPVSPPRGVLLVPDCVTTFREDVIHLSDEGGGEPEMRVIEGFEIVLEESDGYGLMLPSLAARWSEELKLGYVASGFNTRNSWEKGMVFCFDFLDFAEKHGGKYIVKDAWGNDVDIREVELVLTTSMLKLWKCYNSMEHYLECCERNRYGFGIAKTTPRVLENEHNTNYQFLQVLDLDEAQLEELVRPTKEYINDVLTGDYRKALLFLCGVGLTEENVLTTAPPVARAIMAEPRLFDDPYVKQRLHQYIRRRIDDAKIGVLGVHGNYSMVCGDPYALCQSIFGLEVTGLLKAGEVYNRYWVDAGAEHVGVFRAPMSARNNARKMAVARNDEIDYWYRYITTCTLINAWDSLAAALNGMDKDGDLVFLTDNRVIVDNIQPLPTIFCAQRNGAKKEVSEDDLIRANIASFGSDIGRTTNYITSMYDVQAGFPPDSLEYRTLDYRIMCGQLFQQNCIDKAKGVICKPMPHYWHDRYMGSLPEDVDRELCNRIVADKKPYFMRYIYSAVSRSYNEYVSHSASKCVRRFRMTIDELEAMPAEERTEEQNEFLYYYHERMPVGDHPCTMNRICWSVEREFRGRPSTSCTAEGTKGDLLRTGAEYNSHQYRNVEEALKRYVQAASNKSRRDKTQNRNSRGGDALENEMMVEQFKREATQACVDIHAFCEIMVDLCYNTVGNRQFFWRVAGDDIAALLAEKNGGRISFPVADSEGDIIYKGERYSMHEMEVPND